MTSRLKTALAASALCALMAACATAGGAAPAGKPAEKADAGPAKAVPRGLDATGVDAFPSTYKPLPSRPTAIVGATVLTADGRQIENGVVIMA